ncbi:MAG: HDIG domain-containing protein [Prevotella sp.]|nr:HDIG domain-containing protein [Prevotella sp.]
MSFINNEREQHFWRNWATRILLIVITVSLIVSLMPRGGQQLFHYEVGKPWMYNSFFARFDFPVYKTDETIQDERDSLMQYFQPYYSYNKDKEKQMITMFRADFRGGIPGMSNAFIPLIQTQLHRIYQAGVMSREEYQRNSADTMAMIRLVSGNQAHGIKISKVYSTQSAYEQLLSDERLAPFRETLQQCKLDKYIVPNLVYDKEKSETELNDLLSTIPPASGMVANGQKIIDRGEIVTEETYRVLSSFEHEMEKRDGHVHEGKSIFWGQVVYVLIIVFLFSLYLWLFRVDYMAKPRSVIMLYLMVVLFPVLVSLMMKHLVLSVYVLPFCMVPIFIRIFMDSRTAFVTHVAVVLISAAAVKYQYEFIIIQLVAGLAAIYSLRELSRRSQVFKTAIVVFMASSAVYFSIQLMQSNGIDTLDVAMYFHFFINGILLLLAYPLMFVIEKTFGFISDVTLFELSNTNKGVLRSLSEIAPGTFQHSITVGNLAANIANRIGANGLLVRTGALYHDIGKMENPAYFTENQSGINPLEKMDRKDAARVIINHVSDGIKLAEEFDLPAFVKDFILTHHGFGMAKYFYVMYQNEHPEEVVDKSLFAYPGPNPATREQAILMMADTCEAASRSLKEYTNESISVMVNKLIDGQVAAGYFTECPITFRDISLAKSVLIERLKAIYHTRISYPELKK